MSATHAATTTVISVPDPETRALPVSFYVVNGVVTLVLGIMVLAWPKATLGLVAVLFGINLLLIGVLQLVGAVRSPAPTGIRVLLGVLGACATVAGVICVFSPFTSLTVLVVLTAIGWLAQAVADLVAGGRTSGSQRWWLWATALLGVVGSVVLLTWPDLSLLVLVRLAGWLLVVVGIAELVALLVHRRAPA